jgi:hypothetical protein
MKTNTSLIASACLSGFLMVGSTTANAQSGANDSDLAFEDSQTISVVQQINTIEMDGQNWINQLGTQNRMVLSPLEWETFGQAVEDGLKSDNVGVQSTALRLIIEYKDQFHLSSSAVVSVMHLYREGQSEKVRRMAVVSLGSMNSNLGTGFLERSVQFENSANVKATIQAVLAGIEAKPLS